jgi:hypothetical protein
VAVQRSPSRFVLGVHVLRVTLNNTAWRCEAGSRFARSSLELQRCCSREVGRTGQAVGDRQRREPLRDASHGLVRGQRQDRAGVAAREGQLRERRGATAHRGQQPHARSSWDHFRPVCAIE